MMAAASPPIYPDLRSRTVLITGGAAGLGLAMADAFLRQGCRVIVFDRHETALSAALGMREGLEGRVVDLANLPALFEALAELKAAGLRVQVLVNNAGHDERHAFLDLTPAQWDERMAVNLRHVMFASQAVAPEMIAAGEGSIITLGSTSWMKGAAGMIAYTTAKAAIHGFTKSLARELGVHGIRVNSIAPGWVLTERQRMRWATPEKLAAALEQQALKRHINAQDVAEVALFLASDASRMITGQSIVVDGGGTV